VKTLFGPLKKYATFKGRASRKEFWGFVGWSILISVLLGFLEEFIGIFPGTDQSVLAILFTLAVSLPSTALIVRRLHDSGRSGYWYFLMWVPLANIALIVFMCLRSEDKDNPYGLPSEI